MKDNYISSKNSRTIDSKPFIDQLMRNFRNCVGTLMLTATPMATMYAQTNPVPQQVPYTQNFDSLTGTNPTYPPGWAGWKLDGQLGTSFSGVATANTTFVGGNNNSTAPGLYDMIGKLGFLSTNGSRSVPVLSIKTHERKDIVLKYDINVQRVNSNRNLIVRLQYRVGNTSEFIDLPDYDFNFDGVALGLGTNTNVGNGVTTYATAQRIVTLPPAVALQDEVQFRWVTARPVNNQGSGDNHSFSIDNVEITGNTPPDLPVPFPYTDNFDTENWMLINGTQTNKFFTGIPTNSSTLDFENNGKLFISSNGTEANYTKTASTITYAYKNVTLPANIQTARVAFKWMARGESGVWDYGRFYIVPESETVPTAGTEVTGRTERDIPNAVYYATLQPGTGNSTYPFALYNQANAYTGVFSSAAHRYEDNFVDLSGLAGQTVRLVFMWRNDSGGGNDPALVVDDFKFDYTPTCTTPVINAATNVEGRTAQLNWTSNFDNFEYYISTTNTEPSATATPTGTASGNSAVVTNLNPETQYYAWVRTACEGNEKSDWSTRTTFTTTVSCFVPTELRNSTVTGTTANITWTSSANEFKYYLSTSDTAPTAETQGTSVVGNTAALSGLNPGTTYYWWVKASCGTNDESVWSSRQTFSTSNAITTFPVIDNFNGTNNWATINRSIAESPIPASQHSKFVVNTPATITVGTGTTAGILTFGDGKLFITSDNDNLSPTYTNFSLAYAYRDVTLPADITTANLSFKWLMKGEGAADFGRFLIVNPNQPLDVTTVMTNSVSELNNYYTFNNNQYQSTNNRTLISYPSATNPTFNGSYETKAIVYEDLSVNLAQYAGQTVRLLFYFKSDRSIINAPSLIIDDFKFDYPAQCVAPTGVSSSNITTKTADVSWTASTSEPTNGYEYYVSSNTTTPEDTTPATGSTTETNVSLSGLTPDTEYNVWVRSVCSTSSKSSWTNTTHTFRTLIACDAPTETLASNITRNEATLSWTSDAENFEYFISTENVTPTTNGIATTGNNVVVNNLQPNTVYYWWVRANCGTEDGNSRWTEVKTFTTAQVPALFPYVDGFDTNQWTLANGSELNKFYVGTPDTTEEITFDNNKLFVSQNGTNVTYIGGTQSDVYAYRDITLPADLTYAKVSFDWIARGETGVYDYGRFFITTLDQSLDGGDEIGRLEPSVPNSIYSAINPERTTNTYAFYKGSAYNGGSFENVASRFVKEDIDLSAYAGQTVRVAFYWRNDTGTQNAPALAVDNFELTYAPTCFSPNNLIVGSVTNTSAVLSWIGNSEFTYYYSTTNVLPENGINTSDNTVTLEDLEDNTTYYWWVKANCDGDTTVVAGEPFTTLISPKAYPFSDDFNGANNWALVNNAQTNKFVIGTPNASEISFEDGAMYISNNQTSNTYTITSGSASYAYVDVNIPTDVAATELSFDWHNKGESIGSNIYDFGRVFVTPITYQPTAGSIITATGTITNQIFGSIPLQGSENEGTTFNEVKDQFSTTLDLSAYAGQSVRIIMYWRNDTSSGTQPPLSIDNFYFGPVRNLDTHNLSKGNFDYYPNPVLNELNVRGENTISTIEVYNLAGQAVNHAKVGQKAYTLDTSKLTSGVYVVKVAFENGTTKTFKIIKK